MGFRAIVVAVVGFLLWRELHKPSAPTFAYSSVNGSVVFEEQEPKTLIICPADPGNQMYRVHGGYLCWNADKQTFTAFVLQEQ